MMLFCRQPIREPIRRVARLADMRCTHPLREYMLVLEVEAQMRTMMPTIRAGLLKEARETAEQAASNLILLAMKIAKDAEAMP